MQKLPPPKKKPKTKQNPVGNKELILECGTYTQNQNYLLSTRSSGKVNIRNFPKYEDKLSFGFFYFRRLEFFSTRCYIVIMNGVSYLSRPVSNIY